MYAPQRQCPNCNSSRITVALRQYDPVRREFISTEVRYIRMWGLLTWLVATMFLYGVVPIVFGSRSPISLAIPYWLPLALGAVAFIVVSARHEWRITHSVRVESYTCELCGHKWVREAGRIRS